MNRRLEEEATVSIEGDAADSRDVRRITAPGEGPMMGKPANAASLQTQKSPDQGKDMAVPTRFELAFPP